MRGGRWEPFRELEAMQNEMRRLFTQLGSMGEGGGREAQASSWLPPLDVSETETDIVLELDLPGVQPDTIDVELDDSTLTVSGTRERRGETSGDRFYRTERRFGSFTRSVPLPPGIDEAQIAADYRDGVLEIRVPKPRQPQPRRIQVGGSQPVVDAGPAQSGSSQGGAADVTPSG